MPSARSGFRDALRAFSRAREGNVALTFAFAIIPLIAFIGAAIDYTHANAVKVSLQSALDSTALMMSKDAATLSDISSNGQPSDLDAKALAIFKSLFNRSEATNLSINATYSTNGGSSIEVTGSANVPTTFLRVINYDTISVGGSSTARWGSTRLRVALVLDNTGSMAQSGKMTALKTATKSLLDQLHAVASKDGDVYVSIIPFSRDVNIGSVNYNASWIDWTDWDANNGTCSKSSGKNGNCPSKNWTSANHNTWNGCIMDRGSASAPGSTAGYDQNVDPPVAGNTDTLFPADQYSSCPVEMMGLNYDWTTMANLIDSMQPNGNTNQPIGLVWGWQSLVGGGPLTAPAMDPNYQYKQIIILLSDGLNTQDRWYKAQKPIDNRMYQNGQGTGTCANIKAAGITIYTIQVDTGGDPKSTLLENCASDTNKFYLLTSASDIQMAFDQIATDITKLRVAK